MIAKYALILPLTTLFFSLHAQETKKETRKFGNSGSEVYYVSKEDKSREGPYLLSYRPGRPFVTGFYSGGQKDSIWIYYQLIGIGQRILSKQHYRKGIRIGIWEFYNKDSLAWTYDFDTAKANFIQPEDSLGNAHDYPAYQDEHNNWIYFPPEKHALLISSDYNYVIMANLMYPEEAQNNNQQGDVYVAILIDQQGKPESYDIGISSGSHSLDAEAMRVVKLTHLEYIPAENKGVKVKSLVLRKVGFHLENN